MMNSLANRRASSIILPGRDADIPALKRQSLSTSDIIEREQAAGVKFGPYHRAWLLERAPEKVHRLLEKAHRHPQLVGMPTQSFTGGAPVPPFSHTAVANTVTETYLWIPGLYSSVPYGDPFPGKAYEVMFGGIVSVAAATTPTVVNTLRWHGATTTTVGGVSLGASVAGTTGSGITNVPFFGDAVVVFRSLGLAATSATVTATGRTLVGGVAGATPSFVIIYGTNGTATVDTYTQSNMGIGVGWTWSAASASNTVTCQWIAFSSLN